MMFCCFCSYNWDDAFFECALVSSCILGGCHAQDFAMRGMAGMGWPPFTGRQGSTH